MMMSSKGKMMSSIWLKSLYKYYGLDLSTVASCLLTTLDQSMMAFFSSGSSITKGMQNISLTAEHKKKKRILQGCDGLN
jgi:hypothetical protein